MEYQSIDGQASGAGAAITQLALASNVALKLTGITVPFEQVLVVHIGPIVAIAEDSPAAQAGLFAEDQLLEIDGKTVQSFSMEGLVRSLTELKTRRLLIQRGQQRLLITFKPQPLP